MIEKLTKETDLLNNDPLKADPLKSDPYSPEASQQVDHFYKDWGVALSPEKRDGSEAYKTAVDESVNKQKGILGQYTKDFNKQFGAANASANSALAGIEAKKPKLVPFSVWSDGWGKMEQTYYITEDAAKQVMDEVNKEKKGLVATWEGGYRINSKGYGKEIHEALERLARIDPQRAEIVEMRYFGGMEIADVAVVLGLSEATVKRRWHSARLWLYEALGPSA